MADRREYFMKYNAEHKEQKKQYMKEYYKLNRDEILTKQATNEKRLAHRSEQVVCDVCGTSVTRHHMARHKRTNKCLNHKQ